MKLYTTQKSNSNMYQDEMTSSFTNFKEMIMLLSVEKNLLHYMPLLFFFSLQMMTPSKSLYCLFLSVWISSFKLE